MDKVYVKVRYNRGDNDYSGWNLWVWKDNEDGEMVDFKWKDSEGKFAILEIDEEYENLGFRLRKSDEENEWALDYFGCDSFIDLTNGNKELIIDHVEEGERILQETELNIKRENVVLNLHYYRFDDCEDLTQKYVNLNSFVKLAMDNDDELDVYFAQGDEKLYVLNA